MKNRLLALLLLPNLSFASIYNCNGQGFNIDISGNPLQMIITGNNYNSAAQNVQITSTFDTVISGNIVKPETTVKMIIKDSSFGNPGDTFKATLQIFSTKGSKDFSGLDCIRGND